MCNDSEQFRLLSKTQEVTLGDGHALDGTGSTQRCTLNDVLYVPKLSYNLPSVSKAAVAGNTTKFGETGCEGHSICYKSWQPVLPGALSQQTHPVLRARRGCSTTDMGTWESRVSMAEEFDYNAKNSIGFCETCVNSKHHRTPFKPSERHAMQPLK